MVDQLIFDVIKDIIVTVPGVISFANSSAKLDQDIKTNDISQAVEISSAAEVIRIKIHIILINGVNIREVVSEIQTRVKYELEKQNQFVRNYMVDVAIDDLEIL
ncbi:Asp23/Gls24 family envelope stress response protein [Spiroplasma gladiatoris]|uniref:Asp23/Gls24 family envelope stress response protein n=1 Tax=Spiroplasma gladiatoris TaxID=2143 RepID=A0A4P7AHT5_9MOLU|nr:Asp23/Gls24 family envelope stress response protein [Spiroplasma gladiatoris]QBQ08015.1 Asp23/Gls24 family envelope stress response protein [Spiroplasma gladiatoris]